MMGLLDMPPPKCDPAPDPFNTVVLSKGNGQVVLVVRYAWDGVSAPPNCNGPVEDVRLSNTGPDTWTLRMPNGKQAKSRPMPTGTSVVFSSVQQKQQLGATTVQDLRDVTLTKG